MSISDLTNADLDLRNVCGWPRHLQLAVSSLL